MLSKTERSEEIRKYRILNFKIALQFALEKVAGIQIDPMQANLIAAETLKYSFSGKRFCEALASHLNITEHHDQMAIANIYNLTISQMAPTFIF
jgi:hypothetical protein